MHCELAMAVALGAIAAAHKGGRKGIHQSGTRELGHRRAVWVTGFPMRGFKSKPA